MDEESERLKTLRVTKIYQFVQWKEEIWHNINMSVVAVALVLFVNSVVLGLHTCHYPTCSRIKKWFQFA